MDEVSVAHLSIILQLCIDGEAKLEELSPPVKEYILGILADFEADPDAEDNQQLYWFANEFLTIDKRILN